MDRELWFGQDGGATIADFPLGHDEFGTGWSKTFGTGVYVSPKDFPNNDASYIKVDDGFRATISQHGKDDPTYPGRQKTYVGPVEENIPQDLDQEVSEIDVSIDPDANQDNDPDSGSTGGGVDTVDTDDMGSSDVNTAGMGDSNMTMYIAIGAVVLVAGFMLMKKNK